MPDRYQKFTQLLEHWFVENQRDFPWRKVTDPYKIWVSEIMSHQTQITRVAEDFYPNFIAKYPTIFDLANSDWEEVYAFWDGLGYYSRGKNLLKMAQKVVEEYEGEIPQDRLEMEKLPGIGKYTSAAVLSFAYDKKIPAIDTNISKIISILFPGENMIEVAEKLIGYSHSGRIWNSAMMDLAAELKKGQAVDGAFGAAFFPPEIVVQFLPKRKEKSAASGEGKKRNKHRIEVGIACIWRDGKYLVQSRPEGKSFMGFWEFPGGKREKGENFRECVKREVMEEVGISVSVRPHFFEKLCIFKNTELLLRFHRCQIQKGVPASLEKQELQWIAPKDFFTEKFLETNHEALKKLQKMRV